ncbi:class I SAM-dependent methyltransferase [Clostridium beijerinckii]
MTICIYRGRVEGKNEENLILPYLKVLPKSKFGVMYHSFLIEVKKHLF